MPRGAFIVLEGLDRSGKTTQVQRLEQRLASLGRPVRLMRFPDRTTPIGLMINGYLGSSVAMDDHVVHLLFSANRWEAAKTIESLITEGTTIICDRYYYSGVVYSAAKRNPQLSLEWARAPEVGLPRPDAVVFLDVAEDVARARGGWGGEVYERAEMQRAVRDLFYEIKKEKEDDGSGGFWAEEKEDLVVVDAGGTVDEVAERVWTAVEGVVAAVGGNLRVVGGR